MPTLNWIGKEKVVNHHLEVPYKVLKHRYGYRADNIQDKSFTGSGNMIIHGDNLEALKSLLPEYEGKIKCIYIDPPYNTGNEGWVYNDNVKHPKIQKWLGEVVGKQNEDFTRHDKWLCMMYPRLKLLQRLLSEDGAIFISIDDNEYANLKLICDEVLGANNFIGNITIVGNPGGRDYGGIARMHDYLLVYGCRETILNLIEDKERQFKMFDSFGGFELRELRNRNVRFNKENRPNLYYPFYIDENSVDENGLCEISLTPNDRFSRELFPAKSQGIDTVWRWGKVKSNENINVNIKAKPMKNGSFMIVEKYRENRVRARSVWWNEDINTQKGTLLLKDIFGTKKFDYPKPVRMLELIIEMSTDEKSIILDSFAGSGTTAHAVLNLNKKDGGNRKFILVEMEDYADTITAERVRKVMSGYSDSEGTGGSFDYYELGETLFNADGMLNENVGEDCIREYVYYTETKQYLNRKRDNLNRYLLDTWNGVGYYLYYERNKETALTYDTLNIMGEKAESYIVYADTCTIDNDYLTENNIIFRKIPRNIKKI
ncbi:MAG: site-specific DNA-methyltransferase [Bacteroidetes bacterium]|nr:site-specific DNA-methyltransferase [Bacteroidota bacterium]